MIERPVTSRNNKATTNSIKNSSVLEMAKLLVALKLLQNRSLHSNNKDVKTRTQKYREKVCKLHRIQTGYICGVNLRVIFDQSVT